VLFVVKGLALKGHVFSTTDTPERLAEVFREQVLYLAGNSGIEVSEEETALLPAWIVGRSAAPPPRPAATPPSKSATPSTTEKKSLLRRRPARPVTTRSEPEEEKPPASEAAPVKAEPEPEVKKPTSPSGSSHLRRLAELRAGGASRTPSRLAALRAGRNGDKEKAAATAPEPSSSRAKAEPAPRNTSKSPAKKADEPVKDELENSILAAIAEAVDVLVEDGGSGKDKDTGEDDDSIGEIDIEAEIGEIIEAEAAADPDDETPEIAEGPPPEAEPSEGGDSDDIGDEIQRIIASYSKARQKN
jgi:hypothetical protein